ncbi:MAG: hypothetical protein AB1673_13735 [Actinomycetota bacterium]
MGTTGDEAARVGRRRKVWVIAVCAWLLIGQPQLAGSQDVDVDEQVAVSQIDPVAHEDICERLRSLQTTVGGFQTVDILTSIEKLLDCSRLMPWTTTTTSSPPQTTTTTLSPPAMAAYAHVHAGVLDPARSRNVVAVTTALDASGRRIYCFDLGFVPINAQVTAEGSDVTSSTSSRASVKGTPVMAELPCGADADAAVSYPDPGTNAGSFYAVFQ